MAAFFMGANIMRHHVYIVSDINLANDGKNTEAVVMFPNGTEVKVKLESDKFTIPNLLRQALGVFEPNAAFIDYSLDLISHRFRHAIEALDKGDTEIATAILQSGVAMVAGVRNQLDGKGALGLDFYAASGATTRP